MQWLQIRYHCNPNHSILFNIAINETCMLQNGVKAWILQFVNGRHWQCPSVQINKKRVPSWCSISTGLNRVVTTGLDVSRNSAMVCNEREAVLAQRHGVCLRLCVCVSIYMCLLSVCLSVSLYVHSWLAIHLVISSLFLAKIDIWYMHTSASLQQGGVYSLGTVTLLMFPPPPSVYPCLFKYSHVVWTCLKYTW